MIDHLPEDVQRRMMEKLLGKDNVSRLTNRPEGARKFRPSAVIISYEFYRMHDGAYRNWRINRIENGRQEVHRDYMDKDECRSEVISLRAKGFTVRELTIGIPRAYANRTSPKGRIDVGNRKKIIDELKDFRF
jgi:hypothetical protein